MNAVRQTLSVLVYVVSVSVADAAVAEERLTLQQALQMAEQNSLQVQLQQLSSEAAEAGWLADPRAGSPSLRVGLRDLEPGGAGAASPEVVTRLRFPFPRPWDLATAKQQGDATVAREEAELEIERDRVAVAVTRLFHALPLQRQAVELAERLTELRVRHLALVEQCRLEGLATALDWLEAEEARRDADERASAQAAELAAVEDELKMLLSWPADRPLNVVRDDRSADVEAPLPTLDDLLDGLSIRNPAMHEAQAEVDRTSARLQRQKLKSLPWIDWAQGGVVDERDRPPSFEVGVAVDIPIYEWSPARTRAASQEVSAARLELREVEYAGARRVALQLRDAESARERWQVEKGHRDAIIDHTLPLLELAEPELKLELEARTVRAELRVLSAYIDLVDELDRLDGVTYR